MSKPVTRIVLSVLISLGVIAGVYTSVLGASPRETRTGTQLGIAAEVQQGVIDAQSDFLAPDGAGGGHGCESESQFNPSDL
jgi:hypothetical protein